MNQRSRHFRILVAVSQALVAVTCASSNVSAQEERIAGAVVAVEAEGNTWAAAPLDAVRNAAREAGGAIWSAHSVSPDAPTPPLPPSSQVEALRARYLEADFLGCLTALHSPEIGAQHLVEEGLVQEAAVVGVLGAACAFSGGDAELAERLLRPLFIAEFDLSLALSVTTPDFQALAENVRQAAAQSARITLTVRSRPSGARVTVDGFRECPETPCSFDVLAGEHHVALFGLGRQRRMLRDTFTTDRVLRLSLDRASAAESVTQLANALHDGAAADSVRFAETSTHAYGARVVVVLQRQGDRSQAALFDRRLNRIVSRASATGQDSGSEATRAVIQEWRGVVEPTPLYAEPLFWTGIGVAAAIAAVLVFVVVSPPEPQYDLVFRAR